MSIVKCKVVGDARYPDGSKLIQVRTEHKHPREFLLGFNPNVANLFSWGQSVKMKTSEDGIPLALNEKTVMRIKILRPKVTPVLTIPAGENGKPMVVKEDKKKAPAKKKKPVAKKKVATKKKKAPSVKAKKKTSRTKSKLAA